MRRPADPGGAPLSVLMSPSAPPVPRPFATQPRMGHHRDEPTCERRVPASPDPPEQDRRTGLVARARATDRAARFRRRLEDIRERRAVRRRRRRGAALAGAVVLATAPGLLGLALAGTTGLLAGVLVSVLVGAGVAVAVGAARRRGAAAWDWKTQRHVLLGDPSKRVQQLDSEAPPRGPLST